MGSDGRELRDSYLKWFICIGVIVLIVLIVGSYLMMVFKIENSLKVAQNVKSSTGEVQTIKVSNKSVNEVYKILEEKEPKEEYIKQDIVILTGSFFTEITVVYREDTEVLDRMYKTDLNEYNKAIKDLKLKGIMK